MSKEKRLAKMVMRLAKREAKAHRLLAQWMRGYDSYWLEEIRFDDWLLRVKAFLKDGMVDDDVLS